MQLGKIVRNCRIVIRRGSELDGPVRKSVKIALVVSLTVLSVAAALLWLWTWYKTAEVDSFYQEHRLLGEMRAGQMASTNDSTGT